MITIGTALSQTAGSISRSDARILLAAVLQQPKEFLIAHPAFVLSEQESAQFASFVSRAQAGEPIPYITGIQEFWSRPFHVTPATLIPRPDTETLIEEALRFLESKTSPRILDLGTGSGCIAITLALECPQAEVWACDKSNQALLVAQQNARALHAQVHFVESDWFSAFENETFNLLVSNPPYIEDQDEHLQALAFEPISALTSGADGLDDLRILASHARSHLRKGGSILVEHGYNQAEATAALFRTAGFSTVRTAYDLGGNPRLCCAGL